MIDDSIMLLQICFLNNTWENWKKKNYCWDSIPFPRKLGSGRKNIPPVLSEDQNLGSVTIELQG